MTDQEKLEMQREAFCKGVWRGITHIVQSPTPAWWERHGREWALKAFPEPPQPREIELPNGNTYRVVDGTIFVQELEGWSRGTAYDADSVRLLHDLLERPNE